jgi:hypothetical protein
MRKGVVMIPLLEERRNVVMCRLDVVTIVTSMIASSTVLASSQEPRDRYDLPLIGEVVVVAEVVSLGQGGALELTYDGKKKELHLDDVQLPNVDSIPRENAELMLTKRLVGRSVEVHIRGAQDPDDEKWDGYILHNGVDVRLDLVAQGLARYCGGIRREPEFERRDREARKKGKGMWAKDQGEAVPSCKGRTDIS